MSEIDFVKLSNDINDLIEASNSIEQELGNPIEEFETNEKISQEILEEQNKFLNIGYKIYFVITLILCLVLFQLYKKNKKINMYVAIPAGLTGLLGITSLFQS